MNNFQEKQMFTCDQHLDNPAYFLEYSEKGIQKFGCSLCSNKSAGENNRIFFDSLRDAQENDIVYNLPPLKQSDLFGDLETLISQDNQNQVKAKIIDQINQHFEKLKASLNFNKNTLISTYNELSHKNEIKNILNQNQIQKDQLTELIENLIKRSSENTILLSEIIDTKTSINEKSLKKFEEDTLDYLENKFRIISRPISQLQQQIQHAILNNKYFNSENVIKQGQYELIHQNTTYTVVMIDLDLNKSHYGQTFKVKINKFNQWMGIGICQRQKIEKDKLIFSDDNRTCCTLLTGNGFSFKVENGVSSYESSIQFQKNDIVSVTFQKDRLDFSIQDNNNLYFNKRTSIPIENKLSQSLCPCIVMYGADESVEFISD